MNKKKKSPEDAVKLLCSLNDECIELWDKGIGGGELITELF